MGAMTAALLGLAAVVCKARSHDNFCTGLRAGCTQNVVWCFTPEHHQRKGILPTEQKFQDHQCIVRYLCCGEISVILVVSQILRHRKTQ